MDNQGVIQWHEAKAYLELKLAQVRAQYDDADGPELYKLQGRAQVLKEMLNLPQALKMLQNKD